MVQLHEVALWLPPRRGAPRGKRILDRISLAFSPAQLTGVMGASGCGKTSLLNLVAHRIRPGEGVVSGRVAFNGAVPSPAAARATAGYVQQADALLPLLTVRETLLFAARLRLPADWHPAARERRVDVVLAELGLRDCAATRVGAEASAEGAEAGGALRGVSGGEKRRCSIAVQLLTDPALLLVRARGAR